MKKILKNYKSNIILLSSIILGGILGVIFKEKILFLKPLGDIFINLMFIVIVPLIFITLSNAIIKMDNPKRLTKIISRIFITFLIMSLIAAIIGVISTKLVKLVDNQNNITNLFQENEITTKISILEKTTKLLTVTDFNLLLSKDNIIALIVTTIIFSLAVRKNNVIKNKVSKVLQDLNEIILNIVNIIMLYAPIGLGSYFAVLIGTYGKSIASGFIKTFIIYTIVCLFVYFIVYSFYAYITYGKKGLKLYWKNILPTTLISLATCSSAACIPINIKTTKMIGIKEDIAETTIPLGTTFHKDGSVIGSVFKIMFLVYLFNINPSIFEILGVSILATLLITAIPVGGGTISEMFIISLMGFPSSALPILTIIATVIDAPATVLNVVGDTASSMIVSRMVDNKL